MVSSKLTQARVTFAAASAAMMVALVPTARAAEDPTKEEATLAREELPSAQPDREMKATADESIPVTHEELRNVIEAIERLDREKVSVRHEAPKFTDAG